MPRLWSETIDGHRQAVRDATLDAVATLVASGGLGGLTMSALAVEAGIGRATLYKYFADIDTAVAAWHEREIGRHLHELGSLAPDAAPWERLVAVLDRYARIQHASGRHAHGHAAGHEDAEAHAVLHAAAGPGVDAAQRHLAGFVTGLIEAARAEGTARADGQAATLGAYAVHALGAARTLRTGQQVRALVDVVTTSLRSS